MSEQQDRNAFFRLDKTDTNIKNSGLRAWTCLTLSVFQSFNEATCVYIHGWDGICPHHSWSCHSFCCFYLCFLSCLTSPPLPVTLPTHVIVCHTQMCCTCVSHLVCLFPPSPPNPFIWQLQHFCYWSQNSVCLSCDELGVRGVKSLGAAHCASDILILHWSSKNCIKTRKTLNVGMSFWFSLWRQS